MEASFFMRLRYWVRTSEEEEEGGLIMSANCPVISPPKLIAFVDAARLRFCPAEGAGGATSSSSSSSVGAFLDGVAD